ncbi:TonB-dependent receptor plug domain-containing protein [Psychrobacter lutiphocae]|uniref:TonB-dependent receptor plug domain-containing protein n=1 Tax=Psychrobacter lutiphocae TaxID=540500 RepID=UPI00036F13B3|nr:TonB-dependent receptor [Psychrobacter lutiphocae]
MGGVINIITRPITESRASITAELGTNWSQNPSDKKFDNNYSFVEGRMEGAISSDKRLKARLSGSYMDDKGLTVDQAKWPNLKDASEQKQVQARISFTPNINEVNTANPSSQYWLDAGYYEEDDTSRFNYVSRGGTFAQQRDEEIKRKRFSAGGYTKFAANSHTNPYKLSGSVLHEEYDSESNTTTHSSVRIPDSTREFNSTIKLAQIQLDLPVIYSGDNQSHAIQIGAKYQKEESEQIKDNVSELAANKVDRDATEVYLQDDWMLGDDTELVAGVRYQDDSDFGSHYAPKIALKQDFYDQSNRKHSVRASIGRGYRVPNLKERYYFFDHSQYGYQVMGNPNLEPEKSTSYQIGYQTSLSDSFDISINGFYNDVKNLIQTDRNNPVMQGRTAVFYYDNVEKAKTYGADVGLNFRLNNELDFNVGYAYLQTENKKTGSDLTYSPEHKVTANARYQATDKLQLIQQIRYESKQLVDTGNKAYSPSWWGVDVKANYNATPNFDVYMAINNLFDEQRSAYDPDDFSPIDNRQWLVGASYHW